MDGNGAQSEENRRSSALENPQRTMKEVDIERRYARVEVSIAHHRFCFGRLVLYVIVGAISFVCSSRYRPLYYVGGVERRGYRKKWEVLKPESLGLNSDHLGLGSAWSLSNPL